MIKMATENDLEYYKGKIAAYKTPNKLIEFTNKLIQAEIPLYAQIHADGETKANGYRVKSKIGVLLQEGSGETRKSIRVNIAPEEAEYIFYSILAGKKELELIKNLKIFGEPTDGQCPANFLQIGYDSRPAKDGKPRTSPWTIKMSQGTGIKVNTKTGGAYCKSGSYKSAVESFICLSEYEMFRIFLRIKKFIDAWEYMVTPTLFYEGIQQQQQRYEQWCRNQNQDVS